MQGIALVNFDCFTTDESNQVINISREIMWFQGYFVKIALERRLTINRTYNSLCMKKLRHIFPGKRLCTKKLRHIFPGKRLNRVDFEHFLVAYENTPANKNLFKVDDKKDTKTAVIQVPL